MSIENGQCLHVILFGAFNEGKYFLQEFKDSFDLVGFNANIVAHAPQGIVAVVAKMSKKSYFIDPQFHAFQQTIRTIMRKKKNEWVLKESIQKLANRYGSVIRENVGRTPILAGMLNETEKRELTGNILSFEWNILEEASKDQEYKEFLQFAGTELRPQFLIAPYFFIEPDNLDKEIADNLDFIRFSKEYLNGCSDVKSEALFAEMVIHKQVLANPEMLKKVIDGYAQCEAHGFILWIDDFLEIIETESLLNTYVELLIHFNENANKPVINLHGSYFSVALSGQAIGLLAGVGHGIEYGESRPVIPVGGGIPLAKFYFPRFHKRIDYDPDASNILLEMEWIKEKTTYFKNVCSCPTCRQVIDDDVMSGFQAYGETNISEKSGKAYPTPAAMDLSRKHYLHNKEKEYNFCRQAGKGNIIAELKVSRAMGKKVEKIHSFTHLGKWVDVLQKV